MQNNKQLKKYLLRGGMWAITGKLSTALLGFALSSLLARLLTPEDMGTYFIAFNLVSFFSIFARFGLDNTLLFFISNAFGKNSPESIRLIIYKGLVILTISCLLISQFFLETGKLIAASIFNSPTLYDNIPLIALWIIVLAFQMVIAESLRAFQDIRSATIYGGLLSSFLIVSLITINKLLNYKLNLTYILFFTVLSGAINLIVSLIKLLRKIPKTNYSKTTNKSIIAHALPLIVHNAMFFITSQSSIWILGIYQSKQEVAIYGASAKLISLVNMSLVIVNQIVPPLIARFNAQNNKEQLETLLRNTATLAAIPTFIVLTAFILWGKNILALIFGEYYQSGYSVLTILSIGQLINVWAGSCGYALIMSGHQKILMSISLTTGCIAIALSLFLVTMHGNIGVAFAMMLSIFLQQLLMLGFVRHKCHIWTHCHLSTIFKYVTVKINTKIKKCDKN